MELLEKIVRKAVRQKRHLKYPALLLSGVAEWIGGTYEEGKANKETLTNRGSESVGERDYTVYQSGRTMTMLGHCYLLWTMRPGEGPWVYALAADGMARAGNMLVRELKKGKSGQAHELELYESVGLIGTVRTLAYKLAGRLKRSDDEPKPEAEIEEDNHEPAGQDC